MIVLRTVLFIFITLSFYLLSFCLLLLRTVCSQNSLLGRGVDRGDANQFFVHEFLYAHAGKLASVARVFDAAEWQVGCRPGRVIDEHHSRVHAAGHAFTARNISCMLMPMISCIVKAFPRRQARRRRQLAGYAGR